MKIRSYKITLCFTFLILIGPEAFARNCTLSSGNITDTDYCLATPEYTKSTVFEIGLCMGAPTAPTLATAADVSTNCTKIFENTSGAVVRITDTTRSNLTGTYTQPSFGIYSHAYILLAPSATVSGEFTFNRNMSDSHGNSGNVCWTKTGAIWRYDNANSDYTYCGTASSDKGDTEIRFNSFDDNGVFLNSGTNGNKSFYLITSAQKLAPAPTSLTSWGTIDKLLITAELQTVLNINENVNGIELGIQKLNSAFVGISSTNPNLVWQIRPGDINVDISAF